MENKRKKLDSKSNRVEYRYQRSNLHRVIRVNGIWGGITGFEISGSIFSEIRSSPELQEFEAGEAGKPPKITRQLGNPKGFIREIEATLLLPPEVARSVGEWLIRKADEFKEIIEKQKEEIKQQDDKKSEDDPSASKTSNK